MAKLFKKLIRNRYIMKILSYLAYGIINFLYHSIKWQKIQKGTSINAIQGPVILAFWHGRMLMMPYYVPRSRKIYVLGSTHPDGRFIIDVMKYFNFGEIPGSSKKDSVNALKKIIRTLKNGESVAITPDGSRGPLMQINSSIIHIAKLTGCPILPIAYSVEKCKFLRSWDRFLVPFPFNKGVMTVGDVIYVEKDATDEMLENYKIKLQNELNEITLGADKICGVTFNA